MFLLIEKEVEILNDWNDFIKMMLLVVIIAQLFWVGGLIQKIYEDRIIRVTEVNHYTVDIASHGTVVVPTELGTF